MSSPLPITTTSSIQQPRPLSYSSAPSPAPASPYKLRAARKMSIAQTYFLAHKARAKLSSEASRPDHNLRLLVGHANLLDSLMLELADAEREQESWFNQSVRGASPASEERHIQWADTIVEEPEHSWRTEDAESESDSDSDMDFDDDDDDEDLEMADVVSLRRIPSHALLPPPSTTTKPYGYDEEDDDEDYDMDDDEEDYEHLALRRSPSHSACVMDSPPELDDDSDGSTEDEPMPPSPPTAMLPAFEEKQMENSTTEAPTTDPADKTAFYEEGFYLPPRNPARLISGEIAVY
ncbi:hypothetical protein MFIFM68171_10913 [Madurella fahalii]|uniref:Protein ECM13 n=1 Tax=Madurella fahalii TaxID=1157608 RepID=A0ABQ0GSI7_9PEZI